MIIIIAAAPGDTEQCKSGSAGQCLPAQRPVSDDFESTVSGSFQSKFDYCLKKKNHGMRFHNSKTCGCMAFIQMFFFDASRKQCFRRISYRPRTAPKAWQEWMSFSTGEQQRSNDCAAVSRGREAHREPQSVPEQIALRKIIFSLFPAFVPATRERISESKRSVAGCRTAQRQGLHPPPSTACRHRGTFVDLGVTRVFSQLGLWGLRGTPAPSGGVCPAGPFARQPQPAVPALLSILEHLALLQGLFGFKK